MRRKTRVTFRRCWVTTRFSRKMLLIPVSRSTHPSTTILGSRNPMTTFPPQQEPLSIAVKTRRLSQAPPKRTAKPQSSTPSGAKTAPTGHAPYRLEHHLGALSTKRDCSPEEGVKLSIPQELLRYYIQPPKKKSIENEEDKHPSLPAVPWGRTDRRRRGLYLSSKKAGHPTSPPIPAARGRQACRGNPARGSKSLSLGRHPHCPDHRHRHRLELGTP